MIYRNRKIELSVLRFFRKFPTSLLKFPIDIYSVIPLLTNCKIHTYQEFAKKYKADINDVIAYCQSYTGCTHKQGNNYIIMINDSSSIPATRKTFTLAHEIGHIVLGHLNINSNSLIAQNSIYDKTLEREANYFAACILCPIPILHKIKPPSISFIQGHFGLSAEASEIAWNEYINYNRNFNISWHNDILKCFRLQIPIQTSFSCAPVLHSGQ